MAMPYQMGDYNKGYDIRFAVVDKLNVICCKALTILLSTIRAIRYVQVSRIQIRV